MRRSRGPSCCLVGVLACLAAGTPALAKSQTLLGSRSRFEPRAYAFVHSARSMMGDAAFGLGAGPSLSARGIHPAFFANATFLGFMAFELGIRTGQGQPRVSGSLQFDLIPAVLYAVAASGVYGDH